jgi:hypothetical protein
MQPVVILLYTTVVIKFPLVWVICEFPLDQAVVPIQSSYCILLYTTMYFILICLVKI